MKTVIKLGNANIEGLEFSDIEIASEYTLTEAKDAILFGKAFVESLIEELPTLTEKFKDSMNTAQSIVDKDVRDDRIELFKDRKQLVFIRKEIADAKEQIDACNGEYDQTSIDVAFGMLQKAELMYFNLSATKSQAIEDEIIKLYEAIEQLD